MNPIINKELKDKILKTFEEGKMRDDWNYEIIKADWDGFVKKLNNVIDETTKQAEKRFIEIIEESEMHGQIILDVQILDDERIRKSINPTAEEEKELIKEEYETKILSARIEERNKVCQEIKQKLTNHIPKEKGK
jgi:hypothetical protein